MSTWTHTGANSTCSNSQSKLNFSQDSYQDKFSLCLFYNSLSQRAFDSFSCQPRTARITRASFSQSLRAQFYETSFCASKPNWLLRESRWISGSVWLRHSSSLVTLKRRRGQHFEHKQNLTGRTAFPISFRIYTQRVTLQLICIVAIVSIPSATFYRQQVSITSSIATDWRLSSRYWAFWIVSRVSWLKSLSELISSRKVAKGKSSGCRWKKKFRFLWVVPMLEICIMFAALIFTFIVWQSGSKS